MPTRDQRPIEYYGLGQSGYTAGRVEGDPSLGPVQNIAYPRTVDEEHALERGEDERFIGAGGIAWSPEHEPHEE